MHFETPNEYVQFRYHFYYTLIHYASFIRRYIFVDTHHLCHNKYCHKQYDIGYGVGFPEMDNVECHSEYYSQEMSSRR